MRLSANMRGVWRCPGCGHEEPTNGRPGQCEQCGYITPQPRFGGPGEDGRPRENMGCGGGQRVLRTGTDDG